jgi:hypothetical protein
MGDEIPGTNAENLDLLIGCSLEMKELFRRRLLCRKDAPGAPRSSTRRFS